ncbi:MAG: hypothetical protein ACTHKA_12615 [Anaerocolumna jejuensis]
MFYYLIISSGGTYSQTIEFTKSGSSAGYITLQSYTGETAKLDGTSIINTSGGMIVVYSRNYIKIIGLEICNFKTTYGNPSYGNERSADSIYCDGSRDIQVNVQINDKRLTGCS